ncbi:MAG: site-specific DNA-methyltransferase, partial [Aureispira sp.]|nr:site-specific DNA-methyltransferase [Aureispira sp.]
MIELLNMDCMDYLKECDDNAFQLAIVDPPYGIDAAKKPIKAGKWSRDIHKSKEWDNCKPTHKYFKQLTRVSVNQIIWGGNYFLDNLKPTPCFIVWDKKLENGWLADCELAWTSFKTQTKKFTRHHIEDYNEGQRGRIHPTQKPVKLYEWLLTNYAKEGDRILDTHGGSMSSAIACHNLNY